MLFTHCRSRYAAYVLENLRVSVHLDQNGVAVTETLGVGEEFDVRVVMSNHPGGVIDPVADDDPPNGCNLQDVRLHVTSPEDGVAMLTDSALEGSTFRSGWEVDAPILTPDTWVTDLFLHFTAEHTAFVLTTDDQLNNVVLRGRGRVSGPVSVVATARATPRWRELGQPAQSPSVTVAAPTPSPV